MTRLTPEAREAINRFRSFLTQKALRMTRERESVVAEMFVVDDHCDAETLFARLRKRRRNVSRATVYRTLDLLVESGLVERVRFATDTFHYEPVRTGHHDHMVCTRCGAVIEFVSEEIERLQRQACRAHGFQPESHRHVILGICRDCRPSTAGVRA